jgi:hypothetical protein
VTLNTPFVTTFVPVAAVPGTATAVTANMPDALCAVKVVNVMVPLPPTGLAAHPLPPPTVMNTFAPENRPIV